MPTETTVKDVLYALEYQGEELRHGGMKWSLHPSGRKVSERVASHVRAYGEVVPVSGQSLSDQRYCWQKSAA
jgi:hypothetical protein